MALDKETNTPKFDSTPKGFLADPDAAISIRGGSDSFDQQTRLSQMANLSVVPETTIDKESYTYKNEPKDIDVEGGTKESITAEGDITLLPQDKERKKLRSLAGELELPETYAVPFSDTTVPLARDTYGTSSNIASAIVGEADDADYVPDEYDAIEQAPMKFPNAFDMLKDELQKGAEGTAQNVGMNYADRFINYEVQRKIASTMPYVGGQAVQNLSRGTGLPLSLAEKTKFLSNGALPSDAVVVTKTGILPAPGTVAAGGPAVSDPGFFERNFGGVDFAKSAAVLGSAYSLWETTKHGIPERGQDQIGAVLDAAVVGTWGNPLAVTAAAFWKTATFLGDWWMHGRHGKPKYAKGGADLKSENGKLMTTGGYGYNNYKLGAGQAGAALIRKALESKGVITGNPSVNGVPITSQDDYMQKMKNFNKWYKKTAADRGGLVDAKRAGITQELSRNNVPNQIAFKQGSEATPSGGGQYTTRTTGGGRSGGGTRETGHYQSNPGRQAPTWVPAPSNVTVEQGYYGSTATATSYRYEDVENPYDILYYNLTGQFNRGHGGTGY